MACHRTASLLLVVAFAASAVAQSPHTVRTVGTVTNIQGNIIALKTDAGAAIAVTVANSARLLRTEPGQTDLKTAMPVAITDIQTGDRMLARGLASPDGKSLTADLIVLMKHADVAARQEQEKQDWQRRGIGGLVKSVDTATGTIVLATTGLGTDTFTVDAGKNTIVRQYAPNSVKFDDATLSSIDRIKPGDQLRARGNRAPGAATMSAEEIVFGTFRNVAGTVISTDVANHTITVMDLATKKPVVVKITAESQMHRLPEMVAQFIARRMREGTAGPENDRERRAEGPPQGQRGPGRFGGGGPRNADMSQMLARMPQVSIEELKKGDALMIVTTDGNGEGVSAVTLLAGVEPILAAPNPLAASTILSPWSIGAGGGEEQ